MKTNILLKIETDDDFIKMSSGEVLKLVKDELKKLACIKNVIGYVKEGQDRKPKPITNRRLT